MDNWDTNNSNKNSNEPTDFIIIDEPYTYNPDDFGEKRKNKKEKKLLQLTRTGFVLTLVICMLLTSALSIFGYNLASEYGLPGTSKTISATNYTLAKSTGSEKSVEEIIAANENSVVSITTESMSTDNWMQNYVTQGAGSGVIIDTKGYIVTCNHVIEGASKVTVTLKDKTELTAKVIGTDAENDIAVIKINAKGLTAASYGDSSELSVGDMVVAIGNPLGELGGTATSGIISALDRELTIDNKTMRLLQTDASINPGNSGGGLFDAYGNLIGIVVAKSSGSDVEGLGFAIPSSKVSKIAKSLIENGSTTSTSASENSLETSAIIGVGVTEIDEDTAASYGLSEAGIYIGEIESNEAKEAGFKEGDIIYSLGENRTPTLDSLASALGKYSPGDKAKVTIIRNNQKQTLTVTLQKATN